MDFVVVINKLQSLSTMRDKFFRCGVTFHLDPVKLALDTIKSLWPELEPHTDLYNSSLLEGLELVLNNCLIQQSNLYGSMVPSTS